MSIDIIESLLACGRLDQDDLARRFASSYQWSRGYGPGAARMLKQIRKGQPWQQANCSVYPDGSYGNGGAMRVAPIGLYFGITNTKQLIDAARASAAVTHGHPLGQEGAVLIALTAAAAAADMDSLEIISMLADHARTEVFQNRLTTAGNWLQQGKSPEPGAVAASLGNGIAAADSCVTAVFLALALRRSSFSSLLARVKEVGGDVDTIGAMAGGIWGAACGRTALPTQLLQQLEQAEYLRQLAEDLAGAVKEN
jgi:ADP-ribosylglycohydrolase